MADNVINTINPIVLTATIAPAATAAIAAPTTTTAAYLCLVLLVLQLLLLPQLLLLGILYHARNAVHGAATADTNAAAVATTYNSSFVLLPQRAPLAHPWPLRAPT